MTATITLGSFTTSSLTAQPYGYDGDARFGLTARAFRISGLLTPAQWSALLGEYNTWKGNRLNDQDTLASEAVGTTISLSINNANGISVSNVACWFSEAPSGDQVGAYISATATLIDAAQAVAAIVRERTRKDEQAVADAGRVSCEVIAANLQRQKDEADCEIAALEDGLADDLAAQAVTKELINKTADVAARTGNQGDIAALDTSLQLLQQQAELDALGGGNADALAEIAVAREKLDAQASLDARAPEAENLAAIAVAREKQDKTAQLAARAPEAENIAALDVDLQIQSQQAELDALTAGAADTLAEIAVAREKLDAQASLDARTPEAENLATIQVALEKLNKQANLDARAAEAEDLALLDLQQQLQDTNAQLAAYGGSEAEDLAGAMLDLEMARTAADVAAKGARLEDLKESRSLQSLYDRYISEDLPDLGTITLGSCTIKLTKPAGARVDFPTVQLTAGGASYITGAWTSHVSRQIEGIITSGTYENLLTWFDNTVSATPSSGTWFPVSSPSGSAEPFLISGVKATRYSVSLQVVQIK